MTEHIVSAWDAISQFLTNKAISIVGAAGLVVSAEASKISPYVNLSEDGFWLLTYAGWMQAIGCLWISTLFLEKIGVFRFLKWLWEKVFVNVKSE